MSRLYRLPSVTRPLGVTCLFPTSIILFFSRSILTSFSSIPFQIIFVSFVAVQLTRPLALHHL